ncbi:hypothetical protein CALCODRAFT_559293 [Calocera cornea HHB12733]|uniref:Uncharacterized protein n=1 Tax=Calocera cornea HHB12733 TaxID=1353952 RepID=A0A166JGQ0_9BASI|nr:hypothetical protein CALCODRAFT_559293 [Calocera cornea HHB12733]
MVDCADNTTLALVAGIFMAAGVILRGGDSYYSHVTGYSSGGPVVGQSDFATRLLGEGYPSFYNKQPYKFIVTCLPMQEVFSLQQHNGTGGTITKRVVLLVPTTLLVVELSFSLTTSLRNFSMTHAPWYQNKATFYVVIPSFEILVLTLFPAARLDGLFYLYAPDEVIRQGNEMEMSCRPWVCLYHYFDVAGSQFMLH